MSPNRSNERARALPALRLLPLSLALAAAAGCRSTPQAAPADDANPKQPIEEIVAAENTPDSIGKVLVDLDARIRAWTNLTMTAVSDGDRRKARQLEQNLMFVAHKRRDELIAELESGPPNNRIVAASALGFTREAEAHSPLIAALEDSNVQVVSNALLGLALLGRADTPLERICDLLQTSTVGSVRSNAALCAANLVQAGARADCLLPSARFGLLDVEPGVRSQSALILAALVDRESLTAIGERIYDPVPLVGAACARAVAHVGLESPHDKGQAARILVKAFEDTDGPVRMQVQRGLASLAGGNYGEELKEWKQWAARLP